MTPPPRRRIGRSVDTPFSPRQLPQWGSLPEDLRAMKMKSFNDPKIPPGRKFTHVQKIPLEHQSSKEMQDEIERIMRRNIREARGGPNHQFLLEKYEWWLANGKPTMSPQHGGAVNKHDQRLTQGKGSGVWQDDIEHTDPKHRKRVDISDLVEG